MKQMTEVARATDLAWAAGFFDGEGHISCRDRISRRTGRQLHSLVMTVTQKDRRPLERFQQILELGVIYECPKPNGLMHSWRLHSAFRILIAMPLIQPYLAAPKQEAWARAKACYHQDSKESGYETND